MPNNGYILSLLQYQFVGGRANSTEDCMLQIKRRHQDMKDQKSGPIPWSNTEYIGPMTVFGLLCLISIGIHCLLWAKNRPRTGPRQRQDVEMN